MRFVVRQPIVDREHRVFAHELFFANSTGGTSTAERLARPSSPVALQDVTDGRFAFVNMNEDALLHRAAWALHPQTTVIEVLETVRPSADVIEACEQLREQGFQIALDDFVFRPELQALVDVADFIKVEWPDLGDVISQVRGRQSLRFIVERIETGEQLAEATAAGYEFFQGYYLGRPEVVTGIESSRVEILCRLFGRGEEEEVEEHG